MTRSMRGVAALAAVVLAMTAGSNTAQAQRRYGYPTGYGGYGWGGWGGTGVGFGGYGVSGSGDFARGLGVFAAGAGQYNEETAEANSINTDTAMRWNEYVYESQVVASQRYHERLARDKYNTIHARQKIYDQLRNNPQEADIYSGDALNLALDEISNPRVYLRSLDSVKTPIDGPVIRDIPFQYASEAIVTSIHDLTHKEPPALLKKPEFDEDRKALQGVVAKVRAKMDKGETPDAADIESIQTQTGTLRKKVEAKYDNTTPGFLDAEKFMKSVYAMTRMLQGPSIDVILSGVEKRKDANVGDLIAFMHSFNLRFGPAKTPEQRAAYGQIYPLITKTRDEAAAALASLAPTPKPNKATPHDFFSGMKYEDLESKKGVPAPPEPGKP